MSNPEERDRFARARAGLELWLESEAVFECDGLLGMNSETNSASAARPTSNAPTRNGVHPVPAVKQPPLGAPPATTGEPRKVANGKPPAGTPPGGPVLVPPLSTQLGSPAKIEALAALAAEVYACGLCRLGQTRIYGVPGEGNADADLLFIGEGPGADEDRSGRPFVGPAGDLLTKIVKAMGFSRESIFICNIVKCRPPGNRVPGADEVAACAPYLRRQIEIIGPKVICTLGAPATRALLGVTNGITALRGKKMLFGAIPVIPTFHPAYLLRAPEDKPLVWQDAQAIVQLVVERGGTIPFPEVFERARKGRSES